MYLIYHVTSHDDLTDRLYEFMVGSSLQHVTKSSNHIHCDSGDIKFLICHMTSREHIFNPLRPGGNKKVTHTSSMCDLFVTIRH